MLILFTLFLANANNINIMTYTLTLTPYLAAMLDAACRATGLDTLHLFRAHLNPATGATRQPAEESPAVLTALGLPATPAAQPELALGYEPTPTPAGAHGILARAAKLSQTQA